MVRSVSIQPFADKAITHLFPYSFFDFSFLSLKYYERLFERVFSHHLLQPIQLLLNIFHGLQMSTIVSDTMSIQTGVSSNAMISPGWYLYLIHNLLTNSIYETILAIKRWGSFCAADVFLCNNKLLMHQISLRNDLAPPSYLRRAPEKKEKKA